MDGIMTAENVPNMSVSDAVAQLARARRRQVVKLASIRSLWLGLVLLGVGFYLDAVILLNGSQRLMIDGAVVLTMIVTWLVTFLHLSRSTSLKRMLARLVEGQHSELNNALINAVDFEDRIESHDTDAVSIPLMERGIAKAMQSFERTEYAECLKPPTLRKESRILIGVLAAWTFGAIILSGWFMAQAPRFLQPFADHPPYNPTRLEVDPQGAVVEYGKDLVVNVKASKRIPDNVTLVIESPKGDVLNRLGMFNSEEGKYFQTIEKIRSNLTYYVSIPRGRSKYYPIQIAKDPRIESVQVQYKYPDYTHLANREASLSDQDRTVKGYAGTEVSMKITSNRPLSAGTVTVGAQPFPCAPAGENAVQGTFPLSQEGEFQVALRDIEGNPSRKAWSGKIQIVPDGKPSISIVSPDEVSWAVPTAQIPVVIEAQDDLGIRTISLYRNHNESDDAKKLLYQATVPQGQVDVTEILDLADLGVQPGDVIDYYAAAVDSLPTSPQTVATEPRKIQIISEEQYAKMMQDEMTAKDLRVKYDDIMSQITDLVAEQQQLRKQTQELENAADANQARLQDLEKRQEQLAEKTKELARNLEKESKEPPVFDIEKDYKKALAQFSESAKSASGHMDSSAGDMKQAQQSASGRSSLVSQATNEQAEALKELGEQTQELRDQIAQANRDLEKMMKLLEDVETFKRLYVAQKGLERQTRSVKEVVAEDLDARVRFKEFADRQTESQQDLEQLAKDLRVHGAEVKEEYPKVAQDANQIADEIGTRRIPGLMGEGAGHLNQGDGPQGYPKVLAALEQMQAMIKFCEGAGQGACKNCEFRLRIQMSLNPGNTMSQMAGGFKLGSGSGTGMGMGEGQMGAFGRGSSGTDGGYSNVSIFGNRTFGRDTQRQSRPSPVTGSRKETHASARSHTSDALAGNIEELVPQAERPLDLDVKGDSRMMTEYSDLIEAYFKRLADGE
jgi:hypothetical protein